MGPPVRRADPPESRNFPLLLTQFIPLPPPGCKYSLSAQKQHEEEVAHDAILLVGFSHLSLSACLEDQGRMVAFDIISQTFSDLPCFLDLNEF